MKTIQIRIETGELRYAVTNKAHVTARSLSSSGKLNAETASIVQADQDGEDNYEIIRAISTAIAEVKMALTEWLDETTTGASNLISSKVEKGETVALQLRMTDNYDSAATWAVGAGIHDYVVGRATYEWYKMTVPELAAVCLTDAQAALVRTEQALFKRTRPQRPTYEDEGSSSSESGGTAYSSEEQQAGSGDTGTGMNNNETD